MKIILKLMIPCLAFVLTGCYDTMDDKAEIDAQYEKISGELPTMTVNAEAVDYQSVAVNGTVNRLDDAVEVGILFSDDKDFASYQAYAADTLLNEFDVVIDKLNETTTYYACAYVLTKASEIVKSDIVEVTTPAAPIFDLVGTYTVNEFEYGKNGLASTGTYEMTVEYEQGSTTNVLITNLWDAGTTLTGTYDEATNTITVPNNQLLYTHPTYGPLSIIGVLPDDSDMTNGVTFEFTPLGGTMVSSTFEALITTGQYAGNTLNYPTYVEMQHK